MRLTCAACGALSSLDVLIAHQGAREAVLAALRLPAPLGDVLIQYCALFRPEKRQLSFDRLARLLNELLPMISSAKVERNGRLWAAPLDAWRAALDEMIAKRDKLTLPLKSHGYLLEIIAAAANRSEAATEAKREQDRAYAFGSERRATGAPIPVAEVIAKGKSEAAKAAMSQAKRITGVKR